MAEPQPPHGSVAPTSWQAVVTAVVAGIGTGWLLFAALEAFGAPLPQLPAMVNVILAILAVGVGTQAVLTRQAIQVRRRPIAPRRAVALLVLGKACLLTGAALAGGYAAIAIHSWSRMEAELPRQRLISSAIAIVASVALAIAGAFLERACRIPRPPKQDATPSGMPDSGDSPD